MQRSDGTLAVCVMQLAGGLTVVCRLDEASLCSLELMMFKAELGENEQTVCTPSTIQVKPLNLAAIQLAAISCNLCLQLNLQYLTVVACS